MNNEAIINKLDEINDISNLCDRIVALKEFEKDYKSSDFFKLTKINIIDLYYSYCKDQLYRLDTIFDIIQEKISTLDLQNVQDLFQHMTEKSTTEVQEMRDTLSDLTDTMKTWGTK